MNSSKRRGEVIRTQIVPPLESAGVIDRPRLRELLSNIQSSRLTVVQAPAGYGKTTALIQWFQLLKTAGGRVCWFTADASDLTAAGLLVYLATALSEVLPQPAARRLGSFSRFSFLAAPESILAAIVDCLVDDDKPQQIFVDDAHLLSAAAAGALARLIDHAPATTHFVVASREVLKLPLARLRGRGHLLEIGAEELKFTHAETRSLLDQGGHAALAEADVERLVSRTEGWVTGLKLASLTMGQESDAQRFIEAFSGRRRHVTDFFEDVFALQSSGVREFLLGTSVLEMLCPDLCDAITGRGNGRAMIDRIEKAGLFLSPLDDERNWHRYHSLFAEFLRRRLRDLHPDSERDLHRRASEWLSRTGMHADAFAHAWSSGDPAWLGQLLEDHCEDLTYTGFMPLVASFAGKLPESTLARLPKVLLTLAWRHTRYLRLAEATRHLDAAHARIASLEHEGTAPEEIEHLKRLELHGRVMLAAAQDDAPRVEEQCQSLLQAFGHTRPYLTCTLYAQLISARREQYKFEDLERLEALARAELEHSGFPFAAISLLSAIGPALFAAGKTAAARRALEQALEEAVRFAGINSGLSALAALPLAELVYELNDVAHASRLVDGHLGVAREWGFLDQLTAGHTVRARLMHASGSLQAAHATLDAGMAIAQECGLERLALQMTAERVRLHLRSGSPMQAEAAAEINGKVLSPRQLEASAVLPGFGSTTCQELRALIWVRVALTLDRTYDASHVSRQWRNYSTQHRAARSQIRWGLLLAEALAARGEEQAAHRALRDALAVGASSGFTRSFLDEGLAIEQMLRDMYGEAGNGTDRHPTDSFGCAILLAFDMARGSSRNAPPSAEPANSLVGRLTARELEILALASSGMRNSEIGKRLGLKEGSVKWYMRQVYDKIGTRRRWQAVERARQFGLIG
jgi:LuxR family transcriptional regulator, maltose regulon positive regulatory protein